MIEPRRVALLAAAVLVVDLAMVTVRDQSGSPVVAESPNEDPVPPPSPTAAERRVETLDEQLGRVTGFVEAIRGFEFPAPPDVRYATREELRDEVEQEIEDYTEEDAALDQGLLVALAQIPPGLDLRSVLVAAYGEQVAGYYDPESAELVVGAQDTEERVGRLDEITLAHELGHALVDARIGLPELEAFGEEQADELLAAQALVEGDATALMNRFAMEAMSALDQLLLAREAAELLERMASFTELPWALQRGFEFPYLEGAAFVEHLLQRGGWDAVDRAYDAPPATTLEILDPSLYGTVEVRPPADFGLLDPGSWTLQRTLSFGAFDLQVLLEAPGGDPARAVPGSADLALDWRGGAVRQWTSADAVTVAVVISDAGGRLCNAFVTWHGSAFPQAAAVDPPPGARYAADGPGRDAVIACPDGEVRLGIAPDMATANRAIGTAV